MRYLKDFDTPRALRRYDLKVEDNHVIVRYNRILPSEQNQEIPDEDMLISQMHIANIPSVVGAIFKVFQTDDTRGAIWQCEEHGDVLEVSMISDDRGTFDSLEISDKSRRLKTELPNLFEFVFEDPKVTIYSPLPRTPTPAMIWVTDTLKKIHEEWEERKKGTPE